MNNSNESGREKRFSNFDFLVRKGIGAYCIPLYMSRENESQEDLAKALNVSRTMISKWKNLDVLAGPEWSEHSRKAPTFNQILSLSLHYGIPLNSMLVDILTIEGRESGLFDEKALGQLKRLIDLGIGKGKQPDMQDDKGLDHFGIINKLQRARYVGFFIANSTKRRIEHFVMETASAAQSASVPAFIRVMGKAENIYRGNIVSPPNQKHLYIYMRQDSGKNDRGIAAFRIDEDMQGEFVCGSGVLFSTDRKTEEKRLQWVVIIRIGENDNPTTAECNEKSAPRVQSELARQAAKLNKNDLRFEVSESVKKADDILLPILEEPIPNPHGCYLELSCLRERQRVLYENVYEDHIGPIGFHGDWVSAHGDL